MNGPLTTSRYGELIISINRARALTPCQGVWHSCCLLVDLLVLVDGSRIQGKTHNYAMSASQSLSRPSQNIPDELAKAKTTGEVIAKFFQPPIGALIAAILSTFGIWLIACLLYVSVQMFLSQTQVR